MQIKICSTFGHREVFENISEKITTAVIKAVEQGCEIFYTGAMGEFDNQFSAAVRKVQKYYPHIKLICVKPYSYTAVWSKAGYSSHKGSNKQAVLKAIYNSINNNKPAVVSVKGNGSTGHYVCVVGYKNVSNPNSLSESNFLIIDSASKTAFNRGITSMTSGSTGYSIHSNLQYITK